MDENIIDEFQDSSKTTHDCVEPTISQSIVVKRKLSHLSPKLIGWCKRQRSPEMGTRSTSRSTRPRVIWRNSAYCVKHTQTEGNVTDTDEDMDRILIADDSRVAKIGSRIRDVMGNTAS